MLFIALNDFLHVEEKLAEHRFNVSVHRSSAVLERLSLGSTAISLYAHEGETFALYCTSLLTNQSYRYAEQLRFVLDFKPVQANASYLLHPTCSFEEIKIGVQLLFENVKPEDEGTITISVYNKNTAALFWNTTVIFHVLGLFSTVVFIYNYCVCVWVLFSYSPEGNFAHSFSWKRVYATLSNSNRAYGLGT